MKETSKLHIVRAGGTLPPIRMNPQDLRDSLEERLVVEGIVADPKTGSCAPTKTLAELVATYSSARRRAENEPQRLVDVIFAGLVGRLTQSLGKEISNVDGGSRRFPERKSVPQTCETESVTDTCCTVLRLEGPAYQKTRDGGLAELRVKGTRYGRPEIADEVGLPVLTSLFRTMASLSNGYQTGRLCRLRPQASVQHLRRLARRRRRSSKASRRQRTSFVKPTESKSWAISSESHVLVLPPSPV